MHKLLEFKNTTHSKDPLLGCALDGVASVIAGIADVSVVIHSPQGCAATVAASFDRHEVDFTKRKIGCTRLFETDIILGATEKLERVIREADESFSTGVMFVVGTCSADIIGEDIEAVCREMQPQVNARLIPISSGGFRGNSFYGIDMGLKAVFPIIKKSKAKLKNTVNLIAPQANSNPTWQADLEWVKSILNKMGISVLASFSHDTSIEDIENAGQASANIILSHDCGFEFAQLMEKEHSIPVIAENIPLPIGLTNTANWLNKIAVFFDKQKEAEGIIKTGEEYVTNILRKRALMMIPRYRNTAVAISSDTTMGIGLLSMLFNELEMIPDTIIFKFCNPNAQELLEKEIDKMGISPKLVLNADGYALTNALKMTQADVVIGSAWEKYITEEIGIKIYFDAFAPSNREVYINESYFGYEGMLHILQVFANDWECALRSKHIGKKL